jgi:hypothetical protein
VNNENNNYSLVLAFDTDDKEFCRGVEIGRLWEMLKQEEGFCQTIHSSNIEMIVRMRESTERNMRIVDSDDDNYCFLVVEEEVLV